MADRDLGNEIHSDAKPEARSLADGAASEAVSRKSESINTTSFERVIDLLRAEVPVREDWRHTLLHELSIAPRPDRTLSSGFIPDVPGRVPVLQRTVSVRPLVALAACLFAMVTGVAGTMMVVNRAPATSPLSTIHRDTNVATVNAANTSTGNDKRQIIRFALVAPGAANVSVVGDFNNWDPKATPLKTARDGSTWLIELPLTAGRHVYAFVVDGDIVADPSAPRVVDHDFGVQNSVILVGSLWR